MTQTPRIMRCVAVAALLVACCTGCAVLHDLKPHRLHRLNRNPPIGHGAQYSVSDPLEQNAAALDDHSAGN